MYTVPNQNVIIIHRAELNGIFLGIKNENWQQMLRDTNDTYAFALYMYLASNKDGHPLALSPQAIENVIGLPRSTYYKKLKLLKEKGYVVQGKGNILHFYEVPQKQKKKEKAEEVPVVEEVPERESAVEKNDSEREPFFF